jgi:peptidoglycan/LPS O-acetylase OafA/YrhL
VTARVLGLNPLCPLSVLLVFIVLLLLGEKVPYFKGMDKLADVSYPLYLLHGSCGYTIFYIAYKEAHHTMFALTISLVTVLALTIIVHRTIELPSTPAGKWVARFVDERGFFKWFKRRAPKLHKAPRGAFVLPVARRCYLALSTPPGLRIGTAVYVFNPT